MTTVNNILSEVVVCRPIEFNGLLISCIFYLTKTIDIKSDCIIN